MSLEKFQRFTELINSCQSNFDNENNSIVLTTDDNQTLIKKLKIELSLEGEELDNKVLVDLASFDYYLFWDKAHLLRKIKIDEKIDKNLAILNFEKIGETIFYDNASEKTFKNFNLDESNFSVINIKYYLEFISFLKSKEHKEDNYFHFVDYFSWDNRIIVLTYPKKEGKLTITIPKNIPEFIVTKNYKKSYTRFFDSFKDENKHLPKFIKSELFNNIASFPPNDRLIMFIEKLDSILEVAEQSFDIYLNELSLENLKRDYLDYKDKYFTQLRDILSKVGSQIIGLPISISATVVATTTIKDNIVTTLLVIIAFLSYTIFAVFILKLQKEEVSDIQQRFNADFDKLEKSPFFIKYPNEKVPFKEVQTLVERRIKILNATIFAYFILLIITNSVMIFKMLMQIIAVILVAVAIIVVLLSILIFIFYFKFKLKG